MSGQTGRPKAGVVSDDALQRRRLQEAAGKFGLDSCFSGDPDRLIGYPEFPDAVLWLVTLQDEADHPTFFDYLLDHTDAPVLFGVDLAPKPGSTDYVRWERRLQNKLEQQLGPLEARKSTYGLEELVDSGPAQKAPPSLPTWETPAPPGSPADDIWVLGASLGGPAAVKAFLDQLPPGLPVGFVYAQHIDGNFTEVLTRVLGRHAHYQLKTAEPGYRIQSGDVVLMPVENQWSFDSGGRLVELDEPWPGPYGPSIDQVLLNVADHYGKCCHAILFSGMGNDGALAAPMLKAYGSRIWVQESQSCGNSSMPDSVAATGCTSFCGTPEQLAEELVNTIKNNSLLTGRHNRVLPEDTRYE
ncbi:chemotaxis protein CheB [Marinobacter sp.]|uniref:chemotaxis protein CheB n=1 Tax=Marinobacter sp. TaxID=50741 RepID=UPI002B269D4E|nr:chemotaxis protein CheB [Marinobacter sp.]